eukprot:5745525-Prymnesium_polylepis.1
MATCCLPTASPCANLSSAESAAERRSIDSWSSVSPMARRMTAATGSSSSGTPTGVRPGGGSLSSSARAAVPALAATAAAGRALPPSATRPSASLKAVRRWQRGTSGARARACAEASSMAHR